MDFLKKILQSSTSGGIMNPFSLLKKKTATPVKPTSITGTGQIDPLAPTQSTQNKIINPKTGGTSYANTPSYVNPKTTENKITPPITPTPTPTPTPIFTPPIQPTSPIKSTPVVPNIASVPDNVSEAEKAYTKSLVMTSEEEMAQAELDRLTESFKKGYQGIEDQTIPMQFITGQQASMEKRALNLAEPLSAKLARLQAKRTSATEASKFALERADKAVEATKGTKEAFTLSEGQTRYDKSGNVIATGGNKTIALDKDQDPNRVLGVTETKELGVPYGTTASQAYGKTIGNEKNDRANDYSMDKANRAITLVDEALGKISRKTTGFGALLSFIPESDAKDFEKLVESIKANIGFNELSAMRAASPTGGALGQVAVQELNFLQSVLGSLDAKQKPETVRANLEKIKKHFDNWKATLGTLSGSSIYREQW